MTQRLFNLARMTVSSSGVGVVTLNSAVAGFATFAQTGVPAAGTVSYAISDTNQSEIGVGIYSSGGGLTLGATGGGATRTPIMNHTGTSSAINMSNAAQIFITPNVTDWPWLLDVAGTSALLMIAGNERMRVDSFGHITNGGATVNGLFGLAPDLQMQSTSANGFSATFISWNLVGQTPVLEFLASRSNVVGTYTVVQNNDQLGVVYFGGANGAAFVEAASIAVAVDGVPGAGLVPGRIVFRTTGAEAERMRIANAGNIYVQGAGTTASAANAFIDSGSTPVNELLRSTSSLRYKTKVTAIPLSRIEAIRKLRPIEYNSLAKADNRKTRFVGYAAEDVEKIDPALVNHDAKGRPDGVMYDRVLLMQIAALEATVAKLEAKLGV